MKGIESVRGYQEEIIEAIPSTIIVVNMWLEVLYVNRNFYVKSFPKWERDVLGERLNRVIPPMLIEKTGIIDKIHEVFLTGVPFDGDQIRYPGGMFYFYKIYHLTFRLRIIKSQSDKNNPNRKFLLKFNIKLRNRTRKTNLY